MENRSDNLTKQLCEDKMVSEIITDLESNYDEIEAIVDDYTPDEDDRATWELMRESLAYLKKSISILKKIK